jgi:FHS family L-fucose permease-like MFS transporter
MPVFEAVARTDEQPKEVTSTRAASGVLMALFFAIGFLTCLNDIVIPHFKAIFELDYTRAMLIQFSFFTAYFLVSPPAGFLLRKVGYQRGIVLGLGTAAVGCIGFYPAASLRSYVLFLGALFVLAAGFTILQVAANPYVALLGKKETASARLTLTQAFNSLGTTIAPLVGSQVILSARTTRSVQTPYLVFAASLFVMCLAIAALRLPAMKPAKVEGKGAWAHRPLVLGAIGIFVYVGAEVAIGSFLVSFLTDTGGIDETRAARFVSFYWGGAMVGRFLGAYVLRRYKPGRVLAAFALAAFVLVSATIVFSGPVAMVTILLVGLFNSIMFPTIFTLAIAGLGENTGQGSGILCMAIVGGAIVPVVQGALADRAGVHLAFLVPAACYAYIAWYGLRGSKEKQS